mmetsp:Transcript_12766/g.28765  ORF Transcript_12766/g.28765 Transcript_12766/m.28765 type:complete len:729 (+) Transcript_12766:40-2226(+)
MAYPCKFIFDATDDAVGVLGRALRSVSKGQLVLDWPGTRIVFKIRGCPAMVDMKITIRHDTLGVYVNGVLESSVGPGNGLPEICTVARNVPEGAMVHIVKQSEPDQPVIIHSIILMGNFGSEFSLVREVSRHNMIECVGDSDTCAYLNCARPDLESWGDSCRYTNVMHGWPQFVAQSLKAHPVVIARTGVGLLRRSESESITACYARSCVGQASLLADRSLCEAGSSMSNVVAVFVYLGSNDCVDVLRTRAGKPLHDADVAEKLEPAIRAYSQLLRRVCFHHPEVPVYCLTPEASSASGCESEDEQKEFARLLGCLVPEAVARAGGVQQNVHWCKVQACPKISLWHPADWTFDMHWSVDAHRKFSKGVIEELKVLKPAGRCHKRVCRLLGVDEVVTVPQEQSPASRTSKSKGSWCYEDEDEESGTCVPTGSSSSSRESSQSRRAAQMLSVLYEHPDREVACVSGHTTPRSGTHLADATLADCTAQSGLADINTSAISLPRRSCLTIYMSADCDQSGDNDDPAPPAQLCIHQRRKGAGGRQSFLPSETSDLPTKLAADGSYACDGGEERNFPQGMARSLPSTLAKPQCIANDFLQESMRQLKLSATQGEQEMFRHVSTDPILHTDQALGWLALKLAVCNGYKEVVDNLLQRVYPSCMNRDEDGWSLAHFAALHGHTEILKRLLLIPYFTGANGHIDVCIPREFQAPMQTSVARPSRQSNGAKDRCSGRL